MKLTQIPDCHLTYCTNIHPGESWQQVWTQFRKYLPAVKKTASPDYDFGVGARLSSQAVSELLQGNNLPRLRAWLAESGLYIFTINGFPYGRFHETKVKEKVYLPDWSAIARLDYSKQLAQTLAELLPEECIGTISTVPVGLKANFLTQEKLRSAVDNLLHMVAFLVKLHQRTGHQIKLALEPEPGCYLEKSDDIVSFFYDYLLTDYAMERLRSLFSNPSLVSPELLLQYLGICLDTCHASAMYETPKDVAGLLTEKDIGIYKIQLTAALSAKEVDHDSLAFFKQLSDPVYLHQTCTSDAKGNKHFFLDLPDALEDVSFGDELRVHYHVPVFVEKFNMLHTSQKDLIEFIDYFVKKPFCQHLEVETYTFNVLPENYRHDAVVDNISRELQWVLSIFNT